MRENCFSSLKLVYVWVCGFQIITFPATYGWRDDGDLESEGIMKELTTLLYGSEGNCCRPPEVPHVVKKRDIGKKDRGGEKNYGGCLV